jgi:sugar phosphate isomerase/epimerase
MDPAQIKAVASTAEEAGLRIELGTRGTEFEHLNTYLDLAETLDSRIVRSMMASPATGPSIEDVGATLASLVPRLERTNVKLALETYEQVPTEDLVRLVNDIDSPFIGICSDPANTAAILERPVEVIDLIAPRVVNMHVKDFAFRRSIGSNGFALTGVPLGEGMLPYDYMVNAIRPHEKGISQIVEHWLQWQGSAEETLAMELDWTRHSVEFLQAAEAQPEGAAK